MSDEPAYLKALKASQAKKQTAAPVRVGGKHTQTPEEAEAVRWGREVAKEDLSATPGMTGAGAAFLYSPRTFSGKAPIILQGVKDRSALTQRVVGAASAGETVLGCYDIKARRPLTWKAEGGSISFEEGPARKLPAKADPAKMLRAAQKQAEVDKKTRKVDTRDRR
ncbi:MAG TPA: hypothetical protein VFI13_02275 [Gemmatimonadales bacterium]|nr:hypothetical protein [Gemmatimonadales bacterium]